MKAVTVAIAAAGIVGTVSADGWDSWSATSVDPAKWTSTTSSSSVSVSAISTTKSTSSSSSSTTTDSYDWGEWETTSSSSSSVKSADPTATSSAASWGAWDEATTYTTETGTVTVTKTVYPQHSHSSSSNATTTTTTASSSSAAATWSSDGWFGPAWATAADGQCVMNVVTSYGYPTWKPTPDGAMPVVTVSVIPTAAVNATSTSSKAAVSTTTSSSTDGWGEWSTTSSSSTTTSSKKADPVTTASSSSAETWADWSSTASASIPTSTASASVPTSTGSSSNGGGAASIAPNGNSWAMTYTPYTSSGGCKSSDTISSDIAAMASKGFTSVRVYSTDCNTLSFVGAACRAHNVKMILGVFISSSGTGGAQSQVTDITSWAQWDIVELIVVGNEAVFNGYCSAGDLASFIGSSKGAFRAAGYTGPVTTTEDLATWQSIGSQLCSVVDVVTANLYAFFNPNTDASQAGAFIQSEIAELSSICGDKDTYVMESGWPSAGECNGAACPGVAEQATAIKGIQSAVGSKIVFFSFENELWKTPGEFGVEQHWGCGDVFS